MAIRRRHAMLTHEESARDEPCVGARSVETDQPNVVLDLIVFKEHRRALKLGDEVALGVRSKIFRRPVTLKVAFSLEAGFSRSEGLGSQTFLDRLPLPLGLTNPAPQDRRYLGSSRDKRSRRRGQGGSSPRGAGSLIRNLEAKSFNVETN